MVSNIIRLNIIKMSIVESHEFKQQKNEKDQE